MKKKFKIMILVVSRKQPKSLLKLIESVQETARNRDQIGLLIYLDDDDVPSQEMIRQNASKFTISVRCVTGLRKASWLSMYNLLFLDQEWEAEIYGYATDKMQFKTKEWDLAVYGCYQESKSSLLMGYPFDSRHWGMVAAIGFVSRQWIECIGTIFPSLFPYWFEDLWISQVAEMAGNKCIIPVFVEFPLAGHDRTARFENHIFWHQYYIHRLPDRIEDSIKILTAIYGSRSKIPPEAIEHLTLWAKQQLKLLLDIIPHEIEETEKNRSGSQSHTIKEAVEEMQNNLYMGKTCLEVVARDYPNLYPIISQEIKNYLCKLIDELKTIHLQPETYFSKASIPPSDKPAAINFSLKETACIYLRKRILEALERERVEQSYFLFETLLLASDSQALLGLIEETFNFLSESPQFENYVKIQAGYEYENALARPLLAVIKNNRKKIRADFSLLREFAIEGGVFRPQNLSFLISTVPDLVSCCLEKGGREERG